MQYKVLKTFRGSPDGCRVLTFNEGDTLEDSTDFPPDLVDVALTEKWVEPLKKPRARRAKKTD